MPGRVALHLVWHPVWFMVIRQSRSPAIDPRLTFFQRRRPPNGTNFILPIVPVALQRPNDRCQCSMSQIVLEVTQATSVSGWSSPLPLEKRLLSLLRPSGPSCSAPLRILRIQWKKRRCWRGRCGSSLDLFRVRASARRGWSAFTQKSCVFSCHCAWHERVVVVSPDPSA